VSGPRDRHAPTTAQLDERRRWELVNQAEFVYDLIDACASKVKNGTASPFAIEVMQLYDVERAEERQKLGRPAPLPPVTKAVQHPIE